jgi:hypothetical protein
MSTNRFLSLIFFFGFISVSSARPWSTTSGKSTEAEFVKRDASAVTLKMSDGTDNSIAITMLTPDDQAWLEQNHPLVVKKAPETQAAFDTLNFGDKHDVVLAKLKASESVELMIPESMIARTGLNGIFRTRQLIGGQHAMLFFDFTEDNRLMEINVRTILYPASDYNEKLVPCIKAFSNLLSALHGNPLQAVPYINCASIPSGGMVFSHLWRLESGGSALLGIGCDNSQYQVVVRFTRDKIEPVNSSRSSIGEPDIHFEP